MSEELKDIVIAEKPDLTFKCDNGDKIRILSTEDETFLEERYQQIIDFMVNNHSQDHSEEVKNDLYGQLQGMWYEVSGKQGKLNDISFNLILYRAEYKYLLTLIKDKVEYNVDTIFYGLELQKMIEQMVSEEKYESDNQAKGFVMTAVDIHYLYHIVSKNTVKGLGKNSRLFAEIIRRIALSSNIFNHYKTKFDSLSKAIQMWVASLDEGFVIDEGDPVYQLIWGESDNKPTFTEKESVEKVED